MPLAVRGCGELHPRETIDFYVYRSRDKLSLKGLYHKIWLHQRGNLTGHFETRIGSPALLDTSSRGLIRAMAYFIPVPIDFQRPKICLDYCLSIFYTLKGWMCH
jgi:hypothetical protein